MPTTTTPFTSVSHNVRFDLFLANPDCTDGVEMRMAGCEIRITGDLPPAPVLEIGYLSPAYPTWIVGVSGPAEENDSLRLFICAVWQIDRRLTRDGPPPPRILRWVRNHAREDVATFLQQVDAVYGFVAGGQIKDLHA